VTDGAETAPFEAVPADPGQPVTAPTGASWPADAGMQATATGLAAEHPEVLVGAAFIGGLALATILKRLAP
jgi:hypothetical protein